MVCDGEFGVEAKDCPSSSASAGAVRTSVYDTGARWVKDQGRGRQRRLGYAGCKTSLKCLCTFHGK